MDDDWLFTYAEPVIAAGLELDQIAAPTSAAPPRPAPAGATVNVSTAHIAPQRFIYG